MKQFFKTQFVAIGAPVAMAVIALGACTSVVAQTTSKKPNIVVIMADDIGWSNIGAYNQGIMYQTTPTLDQMAKEGMRFVDYYAEASCTAGRANFITGELPIRTGMTTVGQAGSLIGFPGRGADDRQCFARAGLRDRPIRQEPFGRSQLDAADRARLR